MNAFNGGGLSNLADNTNIVYLQIVKSTKLCRDQKPASRTQTHGLANGAYMLGAKPASHVESAPEQNTSQMHKQCMFETPHLEGVLIRYLSHLDWPATDVKG